ncbi:nucleoside-diphosphate sugar epimerase (plasmid) [Salinigranum rubrum]|uniref:Nucleoside-diphosphate sugar epimerase n=1 Tax=Salinigranum rubrum TaxID=755307 RepID=A0A2I8VQD5_9EURY|nr:NAD-dependent epimerase/dehydratase family protein [Salinigranum rubrum]AUV84140.1 nucleoside-diphosphate sugar epimerase [Salinigranum rubrum]
MSRNSVLVTGSSGTVGTELVLRLLDSGYDVHGVDVTENRWSDRVDDVTELVDLRDEDEVMDLETDVDMVVHLSANARVHQLVRNPERARDNFDMTFNMLEFARRNGVQDFVFSSSREVYGNNGKLIYDEEDTYTDSCESPYTASKIGGEAMVKAYEKCYGINTSLLRFSNVYGRYDNSNRVVPLFIAQAVDGRDLTVYGADKVLDFTYIDDCVSGIADVVDSFEKVQGTTLNIASGEGTSLLELARTVVNAVGANVDVHVEPNRTGEVSRYIADISRANKLVGYSPKYSFAEGIDETIEWYLDHQEVLDAILDN